MRTARGQCMPSHAKRPGRFVPAATVVLLAAVAVMGWSHSDPLEAVRPPDAPVVAGGRIAQPEPVSATLNGRTSTDVGPSFAIRARAVYPVTPETSGPIERGMIVVRDGRIEAVGADLPVPLGLPLIELRDAVICPGFVSAAAGLAGRHRGPETISGAYHALDAYDPYGDYTLALSRGTTTVHLDPGGHRLVSGVGTVVKLAGPRGQRVLLDMADLTFNLGVFDPPLLLDPPFYASSDVAIEPATAQRPDSRLGQFAELRERVAEAEAWLRNPDAPRGDEFDLHGVTFIEGWVAGLPMRIQVRRAQDIEGALAFVAAHSGSAGVQRNAYLVGLTEAGRLTTELAASGLPVVVRMEQRFRGAGRNLGGDPDALEAPLTTAGVLAETDASIALAGAEGDWQEDLRLAAILAVRGGMAPERALAAITRVPAEILGVQSRVGCLAPGLDADFLVLSDDPLVVGSHVLRAYVAGTLVFEPPANDALVVRGGTVWVGDGAVLHDAEVLIEDGEVRAVGRRVPRPAFSRVIDGGPGSFLTPGFIDAHGHLGLRGDRTVVGADLPLSDIVAVATTEFTRVARAGVTTVLLSPYRVAKNGARIAAIKTHGPERDELIARDVSGVKFSFLARDPLTEIKTLRGALEAGKKYAEQWKKYEEALAKGKKEGSPKPKDDAKKSEEAETEESKPDPITGVWEATLRGEPLPEEVTFTVTLKLIGDRIEGRATDPGGSGEEIMLSGTLDGNQVELELDEDTPVGKPRIVATLDREDHMEGSVKVADFEIRFEAVRIDKGPVEFKVQRRKKKTKDGRPEAPKVNEALEPFRPLLEGKIPAVVEVRTAAQIDAVIKLFVEQFKVPLVLLGADHAADVADKLDTHKDKLGVIVSPDLSPRTRQRRPYDGVVDLSRRGIAVALQSDAEDGARTLPLVGLYAAQRGLGGDAALRALTIDAARMYKLDDRVGVLQPGRDGDVLIFDGYPFDSGTQLERVIVRGREVVNE